jgi:hypothetical protein
MWQISAREAETLKPALPKATPEERERRARQEGLLMVRTRTLASLQTACNSHYRAHLERVLADLDSQLAAISSETSPKP